MRILRRILSTVRANTGGRTGTTPQHRRRLGRRRPQPKPTGLAALRSLLRH